MMRNRYLALLVVFAVVLVAAGTGCSKKATESKPAADRPAAAPAQSAPQYGPEKSGTSSYQPPTAESKPAPQAPPQDMYYKNYGDNPQMPTSVQPVSTFAIDVDTASYTLARNYLGRNMLPPKDAIRAEEFINYFPQNYPNPSQAVGVYIEGAASPFRSRTHVVQIGLKARSVYSSERKQSILTFVVDTSGSMQSENRIELVKESLLYLLDQLKDDDRIAIVSYNTNARLEIPHTYDKGKLKAVIQNLSPGGSTNAEAGLRLGYEQAFREFRQGANNRVILLSDGVANVGNTSPESILRTVSDYRGKGINITTVGVGMGNYNDVLLEQLADKGDGTYHYVDTLPEAKKLFGSQLTSTLETIAKDVKVQVRFYPEQVASYRLVGYENRVMSNEQFRNDYADGGEMGAGHAVTALYEVELKGTSSDLGSVSLRYKDPATGEVIERSFPILRKDVQMTSSAAYNRIRWSAAVAEFAGILGGNPWASESRLQDVIAVARRAAADLDNPSSHREAIELMQKASALQR